MRSFGRKGVNMQTIMYLVLQIRDQFPIAIWMVPAMDLDHVQELMRMEDVLDCDTFETIWIPRNKRIYK
jgi:hypothetical protein